ncbi:methyl-accepting chemotaxis protein [Paenibacillus mucilaginosus]
MKLNTIKSKLYVLVGFFLAAMLILQGMNQYNSRQSDDQIRVMYENNTMAAVYLGNAQNALWQLRFGLAQFMLLTKPEEKQKILDDEKKLYQVFSDNLNAYAQGSRTEEEKTILASLQESYQKYMDARPKWFELYGAGKFEEAADWRAKTTTLYGGETVKGLEKLIQLQQQLAEQAHQEGVQASMKRSSLVFGAAAVVLLIGLAAGFLLVRSISRPLVALTEAAKRVAAGDLTEGGLQVNAKDETGQLAAAFGTMSQNLRELIGQIGASTKLLSSAAEQLSSGASQTNTASEHIASTVEQVAAGAEEQVASIQKSSAVISQMSTGMTGIARSTQQAASNASQTLEKAEKGAHSIQTIEKQMGSINRNVEGLGGTIKSLGERSQEIGQIVEVITGIAGQTNLLALNAAIEAARAGENGRGFAVVAGEVRKLAEQSGVSAQKISQLVSLIQEEANKAVLSMNSVAQEVTQGMGVVADAGQSFRQIRSSVGDVTSQIEEVSASVQEVTTGAEQVVHHMGEITRMVEETASGTQAVSSAAEEQLASMQEIRASSEALSEMAEELQRLIVKFKVQR